MVRQLYPTPQGGARLEVPAPPAAIAPHYVPALLQWELEDVTLTAVVRNP